MAYGLIKDTTLTALADGFREKGIIPETREAIVDFDYQLYKTTNTVSDTDPMPIGRASGAADYNISIPEAAKIEFKFKVGIISNGISVGSSGRAGQLIVWDSTGKNLTSVTERGSNVCTDRPAGESYIDEYSIIAEGNTAKLTINTSWVSSLSPFFGAIIEVYPLDADGNVIPGLCPREATVVNTVTPEAMAEAITNAPAFPPEEAFTITENTAYRFANNGWNWFIERYGDKIKTKDLTTLQSAFTSSSGITSIPFVLNVRNCSYFGNCFSGTGIRTCPKIRGTVNITSTSFSMDSMLSNCAYIRDLEDLFEPSMLDEYCNFKVTSSYGVPRPSNFSGCNSLRSIPTWWYKFKLNSESTAFPAYSYGIYYNSFMNCYALDEILNIPVWHCAAAQTTNMFSSTVTGCRRIKSLTFETNESQPIETQWKSQVIDFTNGVGWASNVNDVCVKNSGITRDKEVKDDATYQALKNDPDWFTTKSEYSRYNHDSAVETINSLPDTSAYLASAGGTNTIKFKGASGSATDGGAINTLTAEEIAVAAAKGWTVTLS